MTKDKMIVAMTDDNVPLAHPTSQDSKNELSKRIRYCEAINKKLDSDYSKKNRKILHKIVSLKYRLSLIERILANPIIDDGFVSINRDEYYKLVRLKIPTIMFSQVIYSGILLFLFLFTFLCIFSYNLFNDKNSSEFVFSALLISSFVVSYIIFRIYYFTKNNEKYFTIIKIEHGCYYALYFFVQESYLQNEKIVIPFKIKQLQDLLKK